MQSIVQTYLSQIRNIKFTTNRFNIIDTYKEELG